MNESLQRAYSQCQECVRNINAPEAQKALATAKEAMRNWDREGGEHKFWPHSLPPVGLYKAFLCVLTRWAYLAKDRAYRIAVKKQHRYVKQAGEWYEDAASVRTLSPLWDFRS